MASILRGFFGIFNNRLTISPIPFRISCMTTTRSVPSHPRVRRKQVAERKPSARRSLARFVRVLQRQLPNLSDKYQVKSLGVFGSYVRHDEKRSSDLDLLVEFSPDISFHDELELAELLSDLLGVKTELIHKAGLPYYISKRVMREVIWLLKDGVTQPVKLPRKRARTNGKGNGASMEPKREYLDYIQDMIDNMARVQRFVAGITLDELIANDEKDYAVRFALQTIGEAANRIPREIQQMYPQIPWKDIIGMRHAMAHGYDRMVYEKVWTTIHEAIPRDEPLIAEMLRAEKERRGVE